MKINAKLLLLTFTIITFVSVTSAFIYHTLAQNLLRSQQSKNLINSANDFIFSFQILLENIENDFRSYKTLGKGIEEYENLDFVFNTNRDSIIISKSLVTNRDAKIYKNILTLGEFLSYNTNLLVFHSVLPNGNTYYGLQLNSSKINSLAEKIRAEVALVERDVVSIFNNKSENQYYLPHLSRVTRELKNKNNFELINETIGNIDFSATHYSPKSSVISNTGIDFIIFSISNEAADFKSTMNFVTAIIVISGIFLTVIFLFLFTTKFRKQLEYISDGVKNIAAGNVNERVNIITSDEIGKLGTAFNAMLDEIEKRDIAEKEYTEFISLINQSPSLEKIGNATLQKIINSTGVDAGALYLYDDDDLKQFAVFGLPTSESNLLEESSFYKTAKDKAELVEITFNENHPIIRTGITELKINYLYILPVFHNNEIIAIMELASVNKPKVNLKNYLDKIKNQLAIGLANGKALKSLQKFVEELKALNKAYQQQNIEITSKNEELVKLHGELKIRGQELEIQTCKAIESEKIKSQFLANMSHELRTPQNAILGLTELILKDSTTSVESRKKLNVVLRNGKKLLNLIENILEYSKLESGNSEIKKSKFYLRDFIEEIYAFINPLFLESRIEFVLRAPEDYDYVLNTDIKKVEQIVFNLIGNAAKFTKEGYVKLNFEISTNDIYINVEDTGPGILEEDQKIIFEEFRQADEDLNRQFSGTGLGLAICKKYVSLLDGEIMVKSEIGKGSIFRVKLPSVVTSQRKRNPYRNDVVKEKSVFNTLVISESDDSIKLIEDYLKSYEINVSSKLPHEFDINYLLESDVDLIILDILFNKKGGWKLLSNINKNQELSRIPIVVINMDEEANCGFGLNIYKYMGGKINKDSLYRVIEEIEEKQSLKFRRLLFIMNDENFDQLENELIEDEIKFLNCNTKSNILEQIKSFDPDTIVLQLNENSFNVFNILAELNDDYFTKNIPVIGYLNDENKMEPENELNNRLFETTLQFQYHPLDVLKIIKDRIELIDSTIFMDEVGLTTKEQPINQNLIKNSNESINVLVVDDDSDARFTIGEIIKSFGFNTSFAVDGFDCLEKISNNLPDLILLDIMMPRMDGFQTIKQIRQNERFKKLKVYALTAYAMLSDKEIVERNGFDGLITKPINTVQLERKLNSILKTAW